MRLSTKAIICYVLVLASTCLISDAAMPISQEIRLRNLRNGGQTIASDLLSIRGGARKKSRMGSLSKSKKTVTGKKKVGAGKEEAKSDKDLVSQFKKWYKGMLPLTKVYVTSIGFFTAVGCALGDEMAQGLLALDPMRTFYGMEVWRFFTAASYLGKPSIGWLMSGYYLFSYGTDLERAYGGAQFLVYLLSQIFLLSILSSLFGQPFYTNSIITSMLHVLSRAMPNQKVKWLVFTVPYWFLPLGLMIGDCLQAQSAAAAVPHVLGMLSGHFYHFHRFIWPKTGGEDWLIAPDFLVSRMDPDAAKKEASKASLNKALKSRKRGKGKKLGK